MGIHHYGLFLKRALCVCVTLVVTLIILASQTLAVEEEVRAVGASPASGDGRTLYYHAARPDFAANPGGTPDLDSLPDSVNAKQDIFVSNLENSDLNLIESASGAEDQSDANSDANPTPSLDQPADQPAPSDQPQIFGPLPQKTQESTPDVNQSASPTETKDGKILVEGFYLPADNEIYDLVLSIERHRATLAPATLGLQKGFNYYIPLLDIARNVRFVAHSDLEAGTVSGFFIKEENTYSIDTKAKTYTLRGKTHPLSENSFIVQNLGQGLGDIYVTPEFINTIWPLKIELDQNDLAIRITTVKKLPRDLEIDREKRRKRFLNKEDPLDEFSDLDLQYVRNNYRIFSLPSLNISNRVIRNNKTNEVRDLLSVSGKNDLLGFSSDYNVSLEFAGQDTPEVTTARMRLTRKNLSGYDLPFNLERVEGGDITTKPSEFIDSSIVGRGIRFGNSKRRRSQTFDEIVVEGFAEPDWEVEIYRGNQLLDFGIVDENGEYRFEDVPLVFGDNQIRVVLYGPQGQIEERLDRYTIGNKMLEPGKTTFDAALIDTDRSFIRINDDKDNLARGQTKHLRVDHGINNWISGFTTYTETPEFVPDNLGNVEQQDLKYFTAGATLSALGGIGQVELYKQAGNSGGYVIDGQYANRYKGVNISLRSAVFKDFESPDIGFGETARTFDGEIHLSTIANTFIGRYGLSFDYLREKFENGSLQENYRSNINTIVNDKIRFSNTTNTTIVDNEHTVTAGVAGIETKLSPEWNFRSIFNYKTFPETELERANLELRYRDLDTKRLTSSLDFSRNINSGENALNFTTSYDFDRFLAGLNLGWTEKDGLNYGLRASTSLAPLGINNSYIARSHNLASNKTVRSHVFLDENMDGLFNANDKALPDAKIYVNKRKSRASQTDEQGYVFIENFGAEGLAAIRVDEDSLPDGTLKGAIDGYKTVLRAVEPNPIFNLPVIVTGIVDGAVYMADGNPAPSVRLHLVDAKGKTVDETLSSFDGFYIFEFVKPGRYSVQVDPTQKVYASPRFIEVTSTDLFAYGVDLRLLEQTEEVSAADEADRDHGRIALYHAPVAGEVVRSAPVSSDSVSMTTLRKVRIGEYPNKVRLVLDLSAPAVYELLQSEDKTEFYIELPETKPTQELIENLQRQTGTGSWDESSYHAEKPLWISVNNPHISGYQIEKTNAGRIRIKIKARDGHILENTYHIALPPAPKYNRGFRLVTDLTKK